MPKKVERALMKAADKKGLKGEAKYRYVYGTMNRMAMLHPKLKKDNPHGMDYKVLYKHKKK